MDDYVVDEEDNVQAIVSKRRGDSFDLGEQITQNTSLAKLMQNPAQLASALNLTEKQAENVRSIITGSGAGLASKFLARTFGDEIAGAIGGFLGGYVSKRILK